MLDRLSRENYIIENTLAKVADSVSPIFKGVKILSDGSVVKSGMNYSGKFQEAHDASKASIQNRISNLESPDLQFDFISVETDIKNTDTGFGVDELKVKDWNKKID
ncbi:hypothetical protein BK738_13550 [Bacillus thuringiensis serovar rongseni]|nr:hypothetical protein BK738_13550 [Bacillus thuringiensis serovar rongseni]